MMKRRDMSDFMRQNAGKLRFVIRQGHQPARDVDIAAGRGERVDDV